MTNELEPQSSPNACEVATANDDKQIAKRPTHALEWLKSDKCQEAIAKAAQGAISPIAMAQMIATMANKQPALAECSQSSLWQCVLECASLQMIPDLTGRVYLIPYRIKRQMTCTLQIGYKGLLELVYRSGRVSSLHSDIIHKNDQFTYRDGKIENHVPAWMNCSEPGDIIGAYASATMIDGRKSCVVMSKAEIEKCRSRGSSGSTGPWATDWAEMAKKTVIKRLCKLLPQCAGVNKALAMEDEHANNVSVIPVPKRTITVPGESEQCDTE